MTEQPSPEHGEPTQPTAPYGQQAYGQQAPQQAPQQNYYGQPPGQPFALTPADERTWSSAAHWSALVAAAIALAFLGPLVVLLAKGSQSQMVRHHAVESLNFQLSMLIYGFGAGLLAIPLVIFTFGIGLVVLIPVFLAFCVVWLVCTISAAIKGSRGEPYRYPLTLRLVS